MTNFPEPIFGPKPPPPGPAEEQLLLTHMDPMPSHDPGERALSVQREYGYPSVAARCPAVPWRPSEGQEWRLPELTTSRGLVTSPAGLRQVSGSGWVGGVGRAGEFGLAVLGGQGADRKHRQQGW